MNVAGVLTVLITALTGLGGGLGGVYLGSWLTDKREREKRKADFLSRQLNEFYGPMLGLRMAIKAHRELGVKLQDENESSWKEYENLAQQCGDRAAIDRLRASPSGQKYEAMTREKGRVLREVILPLHRKFVEVFCKNISLAEPETRDYLPGLIEYVEVWGYYLQDKFAIQTPQTFGIDDARLDLFYANIEKSHDKLRAELATPRPKA
jgi:hypothetical protein